MVLFRVLMGTTFVVGAALSLAAETNVAFGKTVTLNGTFGSDATLAQSVTDGVYLPKNNLWTENTVWWNANDYPDNTVDIDLGGAFTITRMNCQADDNDGYFIDYKGLDNAWHRAWDVPNFDVEPYGMQTRPDANDPTALYTLPSPIQATALRFYGDLPNGDKALSVSEIQAYGQPGPEPTTMLALVSAFGLMAARKKRS